MREGCLVGWITAGVAQAWCFGGCWITAPPQYLAVLPVGAGGVRENKLYLYFVDYSYYVSVYLDKQK